MNRRFLAAAAASAPLLLAMADTAFAQLSITTSTTTPVQTATANSGAPGNIDLASGGSINLTTGPAAMTLNSNNTITSEGSISFSNTQNVTGILIDGGVSGFVFNRGSISITESYTAPTNPNTGLAYGAWAAGGNNYGIAAIGAQPFNGNILSTGALNIVGNNSYGILLDTTVNGTLSTLVVTTPATATTSATIGTGSITVTGNGSAGLYVSSNGSVAGDINVTSITARGVGAQGMVINGNVGGTVDISSSISASGYRSVSRPSTPAISSQYTADQLEQGGSAVSIGASIGHGLIISAAPQPLNTTNLAQDGDNNGIPDAQQGTGSLQSYGSAPALQIGSTTRSIEIGEVAGEAPGYGGDSAQGYGLVNQGSILANGVYDPLVTPALPGVVSATAVNIFGSSATSTIIDGGFHNTGSINAVAYQADATAIHIGQGANLGGNFTTTALANDGTIAASSTQDNSATAPTAVTIGSGPSTITIPTPVAVNVAAIQIDAGATVESLTNSRTITASLSGTGGAGGNATAINDASGTLSSINNTGIIAATLNQTYVAVQMPGTATAINIEKDQNTPQTINQGFAQQILVNNLQYPANQVPPTYNGTSAYALNTIVTENGYAYQAMTAAVAGQDPASTPSVWRVLGILNPVISGSIYFGNGGSTLNVTGGAIDATKINLGTGANSITVNGIPPSILNTVTQPGTSVKGYIEEASSSTGAETQGSGRLVINVISGSLTDTNPHLLYASSVNIGANGTLLVSADPANNTNTKFILSGASTLSDGAQVGLNLTSVQSAPSVTYTILQTTGGGTLSVGSFGSNSILNNAPYLYTATPSYVASNSAGESEVDLTVTRRTQQQLGFNNAEGTALNAVLAAVPNDANVQQALLAQTTQTGLKNVYDQLLPNQGQGIFDALDSAARAISNLTGTTPDAGTRVPGTSLWLQEVNERVDRNGVNTIGSQAQLIGLVGGWEHAGPAGGAFGVSLAYLNAQESNIGSAIGDHVVGSMVEGGAYYRRAAGPLTMSMRGAAGYAWFADTRRFVTVNAVDNANSNWGAYFVDAHAGASYELNMGRFYARPEASLDYLRLQEGAHSEGSGDTGFDLAVASRTSTRFSGEAVMVLGTQWGRASWLRAEISGGYREVFSGSVGDTTANFTNGNPFTLASDPDKGGWATVGFSLKSGSPYAYVAVEGDADLRPGEQRYELVVAGRSLF